MVNSKLELKLDLKLEAGAGNSLRTIENGADSKLET
jgi:hypothetical protein